MKKTLHLVNHTHWDREWHKTFEEFRVRLIHVVDHMLDVLETNEDFTFFTLDGQTVLLEDYIKIKPENEERLKKLIKEKRVFVGPWYTQPDEYLASGESVLRNLLIGISIAERFGHSMELGYLPDSFGQASQIPQIMKSLGLEKTIIWRGVSWEDTDDALFLWEGADGTKILTLHLPLGYGYNRYLPFTANEAEAHLDETYKRIESRFPGDNILLMSGSDHAALHPKMTDLVKEINEKWEKENKEVIVELSNFERLFDCLEEDARNQELGILKGELRNSKDMRIHAGISSSRMDIKQGNKLQEVQLEHIIEPIKSFEYIAGKGCQNEFVFGGIYPNEVINEAWKNLFKNHTHDSICTCCTDEVHDDVSARIKKVEQINRAVLRMNTKFVEHNLDHSTITGKPLLVYNTLPFKRNDIIELECFTDSKDFKLVDDKNEEITYEINSQEKFDLATMNINVAMKGKRVWVYRNRILVNANFLPAGGYSVLDIQDVKLSTKELDKQVSFFENGMENEYVKIKINTNGSFDIFNKQNATWFKDCNVIVDEGDSGDEYNYAPANCGVTVDSRNVEATIELKHQNAYEVAYDVHYDLVVPKDLNHETDMRSEEVITCGFKFTYTLRANSKRVDIHSEIENKASNHRIRAMFPTAIYSEYSYAEDHFGVLARPNNIDVKDWKEKGYNEKPLPIYPQQGFVDLSDGKLGVSILNKGLPEYEIIDNSTIALTLLRAVGHLGKTNINIRPGRVSGVELTVKEGQMIGIFECDYSMFTHDGNYSEGLVGRESKLFSVSPYYNQILETSGGKLPRSQSFIEIKNENIILSTMKKAEKGNDIVFRIYNTGSANVENVQINLPFAKEVVMTNAKEEAELQQMKLENKMICISNVRPSEFQTYKVKF